MRLDLDAMARITAQLVKEEVAKSAKTDAFDPTDLLKRIDALEAENARLKASNGVSHDAFDNHLKDLIGRIKELESVEPAEPETVNLDVITDQVMEQIKSMIPAEADEDAVVKRVINHVDKVLPDLVPQPVPVDVDALRLSISKDLPTRDDVIKDIEKLCKQLVEATMPKALAPTDLQVIEAVKTVYPSIRQDLVKRLPAMEHKGTWNPETSYDVGDEVIKGGSTYRLMEPSTDAPPSDAWQMVAQGKAGKQGKPGVSPTLDAVIKKMLDDPQAVAKLKGKDGTGIDDIVFVDGKMFVVTMTDGEVKSFDLTEFVQHIIKAIGE